MDDGSNIRCVNVEYMLSAEFDNKLGSTIKCQYPNIIPGFDSINLATLMIPDNMEKNPGRIDFTYFMLYYNPVSQNFELLPSGDEIVKDMDILYFISICNTVLNSSNERGATIKAVSVGSRSPDFIKWKPFLTVLLETIMNETGDDNETKILSTFTNRINKIDFTNVPIDDLFQQIVQSINDSVDEDILIDNIVQNITDLIPKKQDKYNNKMTISNKQTHYLLSSTTSPHLATPLYYKLPICQNILRDSYIPTEIDYNRITLKLIRDIDLQFTNLTEIKNIIIYSTKITKDYLCQLIFAITYLISGVDMNKDPSFKNIFALPYVDISMVGLLKDYIQNSQESNMRLIVGTANPIFKVQEDVYDIFYDVDEEELYASSKIKLKQSEWKRQTLNILTKSYKLNDNINSLSRGISNLSFKSKSGSTLLPPSSLARGNNSSTSLISMNSIGTPLTLTSTNVLRVTLMTSFLQLLIWEHHDNRTILNVIKRVQILQLIPFLEMLDLSEINEKVALEITNSYHRTNGDLVYFSDLFDEINLKFIKLLYSLNEILEIIMHKDYFINIKRSHDKIYAHTSQLHDIIKQILELITNEKTNNLKNLFYVCMNFPSVKILSTFDIRTKDFKNFDIKKFYSNMVFNNHETLKSKDCDSLKVISSNHDETTYPIIDKFVANIAFNLLGKFLTFLPHISEKSKSATTSPLSSPSKKRSRSGMSRSRSFRNLFSLRVRSEPNLKPIDYSKTVKDSSQKNKTLLLPPSIPRQSTSYESISSSSSGTKRELATDLTLSHVLETRINKIKSLINEIYGIIDGDNLGHILLWGYINKDIKTCYDTKSKPPDHPTPQRNDDENVVKPEMFTRPRELPIFSMNSRNSQSDSSIVSSLKKMDSIKEKEGESNSVASSVEEEEAIIFYDAKNL